MILFSGSAILAAAIFLQRSQAKLRVERFIKLGYHALILRNLSRAFSKPQAGGLLAKSRLEIEKPLNFYLVSRRLSKVPLQVISCEDSCHSPEFLGHPVQLRNQVQQGHLFNVQLTAKVPLLNSTPPLLQKYCTMVLRFW